MKHELFVAHRVGADLPDTRAGLSLEAADFAHALFTRSGTLTGWNGAFAANFPENDLRQDVQIWDIFQRFDDALWVQTLLKLDAGQTVTLRRRPGSSDPNYDVCVTPVFGAQGRIASVEIKHPSVSNLQLLQQLQKEILEVVATGWPLPDVVDLLCRRAEAMSPGVICSVLRADLGANCLYPLAGPSLPQEVQDATQCVPIGPASVHAGTLPFMASHRSDRHLHRSALGAVQESVPAAWPARLLVNADQGPQRTGARHVRLLLPRATRTGYARASNRRGLCSSLRHRHRSR